MDVRKLGFGRKAFVRYGVESLGILAAVSFCCYDSWWPFLAWPVLFFWYLNMKKREFAEKRRMELRLQFRDMVQAVSAALAAGYSAENAFVEAWKDLQLLYSAETDMVQELASIRRKLDANQTLEHCLLDFADRSGLEEAENFAEVFAVGKRSGGDLIEIMKDTARTISEAVETQRQVETVLASRRYEMKFMNLMPGVIVLYLRVESPGFLNSLYHNATGICVTSLCLGLYILAMYLGKRMLQIEV